MKKISLQFGLLLLVFAGVIATFTGCKKFAAVPEVVETYKPDTILPQTLTKNRVLLISVDGLRGDILETALPAGISSLLDNAKYNFKPAPVSYFPINSSSSWVSMLTGNNITRAWDSTFYALPDSNNTVPLPLNLTVSKYVHNRWPKARVAIIGSWPKLVNNVMADANLKAVTANDADTKTSAIAVLKNDSTLVTVVHLSGVANAGFQGGFVATNAAYMSAIQQAGADIAELVGAVKSRPGYTTEKWLTLITTNQVSPSLLQATDKTKPIYIPEFIIAHNAKFKKQNLFDLKPPLYSKREDVAANILYWLQVSHSGGILNGISWLNSFELEFNSN